VLLHARPIQSKEATLTLLSDSWDVLGMTGKKSVDG
jgi:hypothetical protein